jgi:hypothetical protein
MRLGPEEDKLIKKIAERLPVVMEHTIEVHLLKGSEILEWGTVNEIDGKPIDPEKEYRYNMPVQIAVNHYRRLKRAWKKSKNFDAFMAYMKRIDKLVGEQLQTAQA